MKKLLLTLVAVMVPLALIVGGSAYLYFTPHLAFRELDRAARRGDTGVLTQRVDFPAVRESVKGQLKARISQAAAQNPSPLATLGSALVGAISDPAVDTLITPENLARMLRGETVNGVSGPTLELESSRVELGYAGFDRFQATTAPAPDGFTLILARDGWFDWKLVDVVLPVSWAFPTPSP